MELRHMVGAMVSRGDWGSLLAVIVMPIGACVGAFVFSALIARQNWPEIKRLLNAHPITAALGASLGAILGFLFAGATFVFYLWSPMFKLGAFSGGLIGAFLGAYLLPKVYAGMSKPKLRKAEESNG